jgi:hypothetical protein
MRRRYNTPQCAHSALAVQRGGIDSVPCGMLGISSTPTSRARTVRQCSQIVRARMRVRNAGCRSQGVLGHCMSAHCKILPGHSRVPPRWRPLQGAAARSGAALDRLLRVTRCRKNERELLVGKPLRLQVRHAPPYIERLLHSTDAMGPWGVEHVLSFGERVRFYLTQAPSFPIPENNAPVF